MVAVAAIILVGGTAVSLTPVTSVYASEQEVENALSLEVDQSLPSGEKEKSIQSNQNSKNAAINIERSQDHSVKQGSAAPDDEPAYTSSKTVERGDTITEITRESSSQSSQAASSQKNIAFFDDDTADQR